MKILFIFTGGTIGSTLQGSYISTDQNKPYSIISAYDEKYKIDFEYQSIEPYTILSENGTGEEIKLLYTAVKENLDKDYDGIIITHGTDTLQYSASAVGYGVGNGSIPIVFVSSNYPIENPLANGLQNLKAGVEFIRNKCGRGVFVTYENCGEKVKVHRGTRLIFSKALQDQVNSLKDGVYGTFDGNFNFSKNPLYMEKEDQLSPLEVGEISSFSNEILWLNQYAGMPYPKLEEGVKCVLINAYHSGTVNTHSKEAVDFFKSAFDKGIKVIICGVTQGVSYKSTSTFGDYNITLAYDLSPIAVYLKAWILISMNKNLDLINRSLAGDIVE